MTTLEKYRAIWEEHCRQVRAITSENMKQETPAQRERRIKRLLKNYSEFCEYYFPHYLQLRDKTTGRVIRTVHNAPFHNEAARRIRADANIKAVFKWPRAHAKSTHMDVFIPLWLMFQPVPLINFMVVVSKSEDAACRLLSDIQAELVSNERLKEDFGEQRSESSWSEGEFRTERGIKFLAVGRGQSPRGLRDSQSRPDYIVIDDLDDDELCRNEQRVRDVTQWVREALFGALDVGRGRFIMVGNLIAKNSVLENISRSQGVFLSEVRAVDRDGNPVWEDKWTKEEADDYRRFVGYRAWEKEMMHNPITEGSIFRREWIRYVKPLPLQKYDYLVCYTDPSFRSTRDNDYKACRLWGKKGTQLHLLDCFVRQATVGEMVRWLYDLFERTRDRAAIRFLMEANFIQDIILDEFEAEGERRGYQLPILADKRKKPEKIQRIESVSPLWERGCVFYSERLRENPDHIAGLEQTLGLCRGSRLHDDAPDADEGAIFILQQQGRRHHMTEPLMAAAPENENLW